MPVIPHRHGKQLSLHFLLFLMCTKRYISIICFRSDIFFHFLFFQFMGFNELYLFPSDFYLLYLWVVYWFFVSDIFSRLFGYELLLYKYFFYKLICILFILKQFHKFILAINLCVKVIAESKYCTSHINVIQHV